MAAVTLAGATVPSAAPASESPSSSPVVELTPARLANDTSFRSSLGFRADPAYIRALYDARRSGRLADGDFTTGTLFTAREAQEWRDREDALRAAAPIQQRLHESPDPTFAGLWLDHRSGGLVTVAFTHDVPGHDAALRPLTTRPDRLRFVRAQHSLADLDALHSRVGAALQTLRAEGTSVLAVTTDILNNRVTVGVSSDPQQAEAALERHFPRQPLTVESMGSVAPDAKQHTDAPPLRAGQFIMTPSEQVGFVKVCTSAFIADKATRTDAGIWLHQYYMLTAGHCGFGLGPVSWLQNTFPIGSYDLSSYSQNGTSNVDGQRFPISESVKSNQVYIRPTNPRTYRNITTQQYTWQDAVGQTVCTAGYVSEYTCGTISSLNNTVTYSLGNMTLTNQRFATYASQSGDSGSAAFSGNLAMGIHSGRANFTDGTTKTIYSHIGYAIQTLQLSNVNVT